MTSCVDQNIVEENRIVALNSDFQNFGIQQVSIFASFFYKADFPAFQTGLDHVFYEQLGLCARQANQKPTTRLCGVTLLKLEVINFFFNGNQVFVNGQAVQNEIHIIFLSLSQILCMAQHSKTCHICTCMCFIFSDQFSCDIAQCCHSLLGSIECFLQLFLRHPINQNLFSVHRTGFKPLHGVNRQLSPKRFGQNDNVSCDSLIWHYELLITSDCYGTSTHHWPRIINCLSSTNLGFCLLSSICEALDHHSCRNIFLLFCHVCGDSQDHQHLFDVCDSHRIQIRYSVAKSNTSEHVWRLNQRVKEVQSGHQCVWRHLDS